MVTAETRLTQNIAGYGDALVVRRARQVGRSGAMIMTGTCAVNPGRRITGSDDFVIQAFHTRRGFRLARDRGTGRRELTILPGFIYTIPWHCERFVAWTAPFAFESVALPRNWLAGWLDEHEIAPGRLDDIAHVARADDLIPQLLHRLVAIIDDEDDLFVDHAVGLMVAGLLRLDADDEGEGLAPWRLRRVLRHIDDHLAGALALDDLAGEARLSRFHFARAFKRAVGMSPYRFVVERRLSRAEQMLRDGRAPIGEIARMCGFASPGRFAAAFRRRHGLTPGEWRSRV